MSVTNSWKQTLRLPKSTLLARPLPRDRPQYLQRCADDFYRWQAGHRPADRPFVLHDGPPYANGSLHVGHALNKILKDMILRVKVQQGFRVDYRPGWDCHGLPIEIKAVGPDAGSLGAAEIRARARALARAAITDQMKSFRSYAVAADWDRAWVTMDPEYELAQLGLFGRMVEAGLIHRRRRPVYWSPSSRTALAEAELEYDDNHVSKTAYVRFPIVAAAAATGSEDLACGVRGFQGRLHAAIWTTTPWTLPANRAIAVHRDLEYCIIARGGSSGGEPADGILVAKSRLEAIADCLGIEGGNDGDHNTAVVVDSIKGAELIGLQYVNRLRGRTAPPQPIIHADFVSAASGTGLVHLAPGHGRDDYDVCAALGIPADAPVDDAGFFTPDAYPDDPASLTSAPSVLDGGGDSVLDLLGDDVLARRDHRHKYPYDWRTKRPVIIRATEQWFADVGAIKDDAISALGPVRFIPDSGRERLKKFIEGRSEWCISRQRAWGVPIPALYNDDRDGEVVMTAGSIGHIIDTIRQRGADAWFSDPADDPAWLPPGLSDQGGGGEAEGGGPRYRRGTDTMDVWFDSGSSWGQSPTPADVYLEGTDQHRGWFQSSLLTYVASQRGSGAHPATITAPFTTLVTHGFALDQRGRKMSKSAGNVVSAAEIMSGTLLLPPPPPPRHGKEKKKKGQQQQQKAEALGPDALRLWVAASEYTRDVVIGDEVLRSVQANLVRHRVLLRMLLGLLADPPPDPNPVSGLDRLALAQLRRVMDEVGEAYDRFEFYKATAALNRWATNDLSAFYIESSKDRLYCGDGGGVLVPILIGFLRMLAPMTPLLVEEAWAHRPQWMRDNETVGCHPATQIYSDPVFDPQLLLLDPAERIERDLAVLQAVAGTVKAGLEKARSRGLIGSSLQASVEVVAAAGPAVGVLERYADQLDAIFGVSAVEVNGEGVKEGKASEELLPSATFGADGGEDIGQGEVRLLRPRGKKCSRCWRYLASAEDGLCGRCEEVVKDMAPDGA